MHAFTQFMCLAEGFYDLLLFFRSSSYEWHKRAAVLRLHL